MGHRHCQDNMLKSLSYLICMSQAASYGSFSPP
jgi:hypothetical protein